MDEPNYNDPDRNANGPVENKPPAFNKKNHPKLNRFIEIISALLMLVGIVLSFFYQHIGGLLVGLAFGLCFFEEISLFVLPREYYSEKGFFKTLMWIGAILYFLIAIPAFTIAVALGFGAALLLRWTFKK